MSDTQAVIEEGLSEDSQVVGNWSSRLRDGAPAEVVSVNGETPVTEETEETAETAPAEEETEEAAEEAPAETAPAEEEGAE